MKEKKNFETILLLTDFSDHAKNACRYAIEAFGEDARYILINSFFVRTSAATLIDLEEIAHQESIQNLKEQEESLRSTFKDKTLSIEILSKFGTPVDVINDFIAEDPADLVVVGSKGISKLDEILIGSVTIAIMRGVSVPVLSVPLKAKYEHMDKIVMASDLNNANKASAISTVEKLKEQFNAEVVGVTVKGNKSELTTEESELLADFGATPSIDKVDVLEAEDVSKALMNYCEGNRTDLLVMVAKHTSFFKRFFHKSITKELVNHEVLPIVVLEDN